MLVFVQSDPSIHETSWLLMSTPILLTSQTESVRPLQSGSNLQNKKQQLCWLLVKHDEKTKNSNIVTNDNVHSSESNLSRNGQACHA